MLTLFEETFDQQNELAGKFYAKLGLGPVPDGEMLRAGGCAQRCYRFAIKSREYWLPIFDGDRAFMDVVSDETLAALAELFWSDLAAFDLAPGPRTVDTEKAFLELARMSYDFWLDIYKEETR